MASKSLADIFNNNSAGDKKFVKQHPIKKVEDKNGNDDKLFNASNVKEAPKPGASNEEIEEAKWDTFNLKTSASTFNKDTNQWDIDSEDMAVKAKSGSHALKKAIGALTKKYPKHKEHAAEIADKAIMKRAANEEVIDEMYGKSEKSLDKISGYHSDQAAAARVKGDQVTADDHMQQYDRASKVRDAAIHKSWGRTEKYKKAAKVAKNSKFDPQSKGVIWQTFLNKVKEEPETETEVNLFITEGSQFGDLADQHYQASSFHRNETNRFTKLAQEYQRAGVGKVAATYAQLAKAHHSAGDTHNGAYREYMRKHYDTPDNPDQDQGDQDQAGATPPVQSKQKQSGDPVRDKKAAQ
jgi:hypothetical protein